MKGMVLAAGLGTRLRPLVGEFPKPLVPILNRPLVLYNLLLLREAGVRDVILNLYFGADQIEEVLGDGSDLGMSITYVREQVLLGTGGGIRNVRDFFGDEPFVVANGDTLVDVDLAAAIERHKSRKAMATMLLVDDPRADAFGAVRIDEGGRVVSIGGLVPCSRLGELPGRVFTGIHLFSPRVFDFIPDGEKICIVRTAYLAMLEQQLAVMGDVSCRYWCDAGTPERYLQANLTLLARPDLCPHVPRMAEVDDLEREGDVEISAPVLIGKGCILEAGARVGPMSILGPGVRVGRGAFVRRSVIWPGCKVDGLVEEQVVV